MPSRQFLIGQAALNVHPAEWWGGYIRAIDYCGMPLTFGYTMSQVAKEFRRLEKLYQAIDGEVF